MSQIQEQTVKSKNELSKQNLRPGLVQKVFPESAIVAVTSNLAIRAWSIKRRRKKLIAQFGWKSRDERFEPN